MSKITVYSKPGCGPCTATYRLLDSRGIEYTTVDLTQDDTQGQRLREQYGYTEAPVIVVDDGRHWAGFRPDKLAGLTN